MATRTAKDGTKDAKKAPAKKAATKKASAKKDASKADGPDSKDTIYLIDGNGYIFRAYYAVRRLSTSDGMSTNAIFGFTNMLLRVLKEHSPYRLGIAFDLPGPTFRHKLFDEYKANRKAPPDDLPPQIPLIHEIVDAFQIPRLSLEGYEADDVLATMSNRAKAAGFHVRIITGDKDLMQLVDDKVMLVDDLRAGRASSGSRVVDRDAVIEKFGVPPERVVDVLALSGDASDNIPGVKGIGDKTAAQLVEEHGDLEAILAAAPQIKQKARRERLIDQADMARLSLKLVTLAEDAEVPVTFDDLLYEGPNKDRLRDLFEKYEFSRLLNDPIVRTGAATTAAPVRVNQPNAASRQGDLFNADKGAIKKESIAVDRDRYHLVTTPQELEDLAKTLDGAQTVALWAEGDTETGPANLVGLAVAWGENEAAYIAVAHDAAVASAQVPAADVTRVMGPLLQSDKRRVIAHHAKRTLTILQSAGIEAVTLGGDPMVASYLLDPDKGHALEQVADRLFDHAMAPRSEIVGKGKSEVAFAACHPSKAGMWASERADIAWRSREKLADKVKEEGMEALYRDLELPLEPVLAKMERHGILVDTKKLEALSSSFEEQLDAIEKKAYDAAGRDFNLGSPSQISDLLFNELKLRIVKRTKTGPSTDSTVLEALADDHPLPGLILEHRFLAKLKNTYIDVLPTLRHPRTGRVHTQFNQAVAATGRLSSENPNLQNIPIRTAVGRDIRAAFIPEDGHKLVSLDYSQVELRLLAHVTGDDVLVETFKNGQDVHQRTAAEIFDVPLDKVEKDQRTAAKAINFGLLYGMGVVRLARELGIKRSEAKSYLEKYFERYAGIRVWHQAAREEAYATGEVRTLFGRRRRLTELGSNNRAEVARGERLATNTPIQGSAADLIKRAMIATDRELTTAGVDARMLLQVHDELLLEVKDADVDETIAIVTKAMEGAAELKVPLVVDGGAGANWNEAH